MGGGCVCEGSVGDVRTACDGGGKQGSSMETMATFGREGAETVVKTSGKGVEDGSVGGGGAMVEGKMGRRL